MDFIDAAQFAESQARHAALALALCRPDATGKGPTWHNGNAYCRECETRIPQARLDAVPGTGLCVDCAAAAQA